MTTAIPWDDHAVLLRDEDSERKIVGTGSLASIVYRLDGSMRVLWPHYHISLPDRQSEPFEYASEWFGELVRQRPREG
jgi:hypothetical protein